MDTERQERVRSRAYAIWQREGQPEGEADRHWASAEQELRAESEDQSGADVTAASDQTSNQTPSPSTPPSWTSEGEAQPTTDEAAKD